MVRLPHLESLILCNLASRATELLLGIIQSPPCGRLEVSCQMDDVQHPPSLITLIHPLVPPTPTRAINLDMTPHSIYYYDSYTPTPGYNLDLSFDDVDPPTLIQPLVSNLNPACLETNTCVSLRPDFQPDGHGLRPLSTATNAVHVMELMLHTPSQIHVVLELSTNADEAGSCQSYSVCLSYSVMPLSGRWLGSRSSRGERVRSGTPTSIHPSIRSRGPLGSLGGFYCVGSDPWGG